MHLARGEPVARWCVSSGVSEQSYCRWRRNYGGMRVDQAKRLKKLEQENGRLKRLVAEQALDNADAGRPHNCGISSESPSAAPVASEGCWKSKAA